MHDDHRRDDRGLYGVRMEENKDSSYGVGEGGAQVGFDGYDGGGIFTVSHAAAYGGSTTSLTASEGGVVFCGDEARLELFPTDDHGRAVPFRSRLERREECWNRAEFCRRRATVDIVCASALAAICLIIIVILLVDC